MENDWYPLVPDNYGNRRRTAVAATYHRVHGHRPPLALWPAPAALHPGDGALQAGVVVGLGGATVEQAGADPVELHLGAVHLVEHWHRKREDTKNNNKRNPEPQGDSSLASHPHRMRTAGVRSPLAAKTNEAPFSVHSPAVGTLEPIPLPHTPPPGRKDMSRVPFSAKGTMWGWCKQRAP